MQLAMIVRCGFFASTIAVLVGSVEGVDPEFFGCTTKDCGQKCDGEGCATDCTADGCGKQCDGEGCATDCTGKYCGGQCEAENCATNCTGYCGVRCEGENCATGCEGTNCGIGCKGDGCATNCIGINCAQVCQGVNCGARCKGAKCALQCGSQDEDKGKPEGWDDDTNPRYNDDWEPKQPGFVKQTYFVDPAGPLYGSEYDDDRVFHSDFPESVDCGMECEGTDCAKGCTGAGCGASCTGLNCAADCQGDGCGKNCLGDGCGIRNEKLVERGNGLTSYEASGRKDFNLPCEQYVLDWHCQYNNTAFPNCQWGNGRCCDGPCPFVTRNACCRPDRIDPKSKVKPDIISMTNGNALTECVGVCEQDANCIAYELSSSKKKGEWVDVCEHFKTDKFVAIAKVSRGSKSCRKYTVCGSRNFAAPVPPSPTTAPKQCSPADPEIGMIYKPMDSNPAFCNCDRCGKGKKKCRTVEKSVDDCFERCAATNGCVRINFWAKDGGCHLVEAGATGTPNKKVTATSFQADC